MNRKPVRSCFSWGCVSQDHLGCLQVGKISQAGKIVAEEIFAMTLFIIRVGAASGKCTPVQGYSWQETPTLHSPHRGK